MTEAANQKAGNWDRIWAAPAKLNLFLHVLGRRADGYHLLQSVFRLIDRCDRLRFAPRSTSEVTLALPLDGVEESRELCVRAARLLQIETGCRNGVDITIDKHIPVGGGLGGGSSDAATTLIALDHLWNLGLGRTRLAQLGLRLGADVPFFLFGQNAFVEGVGELMSAVVLPAAWYAVLVPPIVVPTAEVFASQDLTRNTKSVKISSFSAGFGSNDLEPVVCRRYPVIARHLGWLKAQLAGSDGVHEGARMSGSGACVFAEFPTETRAREVVSRLPLEMQGFVARGLDHHPLEGFLDAD